MDLGLSAKRSERVFPDRRKLRYPVGARGVVRLEIDSNMGWRISSELKSKIAEEYLINSTKDWQSKA
jgi:hypothetical protein